MGLRMSDGMGSMGGGPGMSKSNIGGAGGGVKEGVDGALSSLVDDAVRADLSLEGHKDLILSELKHPTDKSMHLNDRGRGGAVGGSGMKEGG